MFRNLRLYQVHSQWPETPEALSEILEEKSFTPCNAYAEKSAGWEAPTGEEGDALCRHLSGTDLVQLRTQSRVLPAAALKEALEERVAEFTARVGVAPPRRELRKLKEETRDELMPKSLVKSDRTRALYLRKSSVLCVDAGTNGKAEWLLDHLRFCFPSFNCQPLSFAEPVSVLMRKIFMGQPPRPFVLGRECRFQDPTDASATGAWRNVELDDNTIRHHVKEGYRLTHLGIGFDELLNCVLCDDGSIGKLKFIEGYAVDTPDDDDAELTLDADLALLAGTVQRLLGELEKQLGGIASTEAGEVSLTAG